MSLEGFSQQLSLSASRLREAAACFDKSPAKGRINRLAKTIDAVDLASSGGWFGWHACMYIRNFKPKKKDDFFDAMFQGSQYANATNGDWEKYPRQTVVKHVENTAKAKMADIVEVATRAQKLFDEVKADVLPIVHVIAAKVNDAKLTAQVEVIEKMESHLPPRQILKAWMPTNIRTNDLVAGQQGATSPPHLDMKAILASCRTSASSCADLAEAAEYFVKYIKYSAISEPNTGRPEATGGRKSSAKVAKGKAKDNVLIFISHSEVDYPLAVGLLEMLKSTFKLVDDDAIFCSSVPGHGLGIHGVKSEIRQKIKDAPVFIAILTPESVASPWVMIEMGAAWGYETKGFLPLITGGLDVTALPGPYDDLSAVQAKDTNVRAKLADKLAHIGKELGKTPKLSGDPQRKIDSFVESFLAANNNRDHSEKNGQQLPGLFVRMKGALWQILDGGKIDEDPYCMRCHAGLIEEYPNIHMFCGGCGLKTNILWRDRHSVRDEVAGALQAGSLQPFHLPLPTRKL